MWCSFLISPHNVYFDNQPSASGFYGGTTASGDQYEWINGNLNTYCVCSTSLSTSTVEVDTGDVVSTIIVPRDIVGQLFPVSSGATTSIHDTSSSATVESSIRSGASHWRRTPHAVAVNCCGRVCLRVANWQCYSTRNRGFIRSKYRQCCAAPLFRIHRWVISGARRAQHRAVDVWNL